LERCYKTFVSIGNGKQYFSRLLNAVEACADLLPQPVLVQCGHTPFVSKKLDVIDFVSMDDFIRYVHNAEMLILHAGAGSVLHAINAGKHPILMPRSKKFDEIVNEHQVSLASTLHDAEKAIMVDNEQELKTAIQRILNEEIRLSANSNKSPAFNIIKSRLAQLLEM